MGQKFLRDFVNRLLFSDTLQANFFVIDYKNTSLGIFSITKKQKKRRQQDQERNKLSPKKAMSLVQSYRFRSNLRIISR